MPRVQHHLGHHLVRRSVRRAQRALRQAWTRQLPTTTELESIELRVAAQPAPDAGSRPQVVLCDEHGRRYLFKLAPADQLAAEQLAFHVRSLGRRLHVPSARRSFTLPGVPTGIGLLQPMLDLVGTLPRRPADWSPEQREAMLTEHPWEWLLANLDTHIDQYVLVGEHALPINIDWDHALVDLATTKLSRFNRRSLTVMPVRNLLYADYVTGAVQLDFYGMQKQAHRIAAIPFSAIDPLLARWAIDSGAGTAERDRVVAAMRDRHARIADDFDALIDALRGERYDAVGNTRPLWERLAAGAQERWQDFAVNVLHDRVVRPFLASYRRVLTLRARGK